MPADNETPLPAPQQDWPLRGVSTATLAAELLRRRDTLGEEIPGIAAPQQSAGARHHLAYTDAAKAIGDTELSAANMRVYVNAAIDAGLVSLSVVRGSRDHDPKESAGAIPDFDGAPMSTEDRCGVCRGGAEERICALTRNDYQERGSEPVTASPSPAKSLRERIKALASDDRNRRFLSSYLEGRYDAISDALGIIDAARAVPMNAERIAALRAACVLLEPEGDYLATIPERDVPGHLAALRSILRDAGADA